MNLPTLKQKLMASISPWIDSRIDMMVKSSGEMPAMAVASAYLKRGAHNIVARNQERIGQAIDSSSLFLADEKGNINAETLFADIKRMLQALPLYPFDIGPVHGTIGKGEVRIDIPDNIFCMLLFGNVQTLSIKADDVADLSKMILGEERKLKESL